MHRARKRATVLAAKLAAILGLAGARTLRRRSLALTAGQPLAVLVIVPLVAVLAVATGSATHWHFGLGQAQKVATTAATHRPSPTSAAGSPTDDSAALNGVGGRRLLQPVRKSLRGTVQGAGQIINGVLKVVPLPSVVPTVRATVPALPLPSVLPSVPGVPKH